MRVVHVIIRILKDINTQITIQSTVFLYVIDVQRGGKYDIFAIHVKVKVQSG